MNFDSVPDELRELLSKTLDKDPDNRPSARELCEAIEHKLAVFLRRTSDVDQHRRQFSPQQRLEQMELNFNNNPGAKLMPWKKRREYLDVLSSIATVAGEVGHQIQGRIDRLKEELS